MLRILLLLKSRRIWTFISKCRNLHSNLQTAWNEIRRNSSAILQWRTKDDVSERSYLWFVEHFPNLHTDTKSKANDSFNGHNAWCEYNIILVVIRCYLSLLLSTYSITPVIQTTTRAFFHKSFISLSRCVVTSGHFVDSFCMFVAHFRRRNQKIFWTRKEHSNFHMMWYTWKPIIGYHHVITKAMYRIFKRIHSRGLNRASMSDRPTQPGWPKYHTDTWPYSYSKISLFFELNFDHCSCYLGGCWSRLICL